MGDALQHGYAGAHERYRALRSSFYVDVGGVIIVTDSADGRRCAPKTESACKMGSAAEMQRCVQRRCLTQKQLSFA